MHLKKILQIIFFIALIIFFFLFFYQKWYIHFNYKNINSARAFILQFGWLTPLVIILFYVGFNIAFFPTLYFSLLSGYLYGIFYGFLLAWIGMSLGLLVSFLWSRYLFRDTFTHKLGSKKIVVQLENYLKQYDWWAVILLRVFFIFPYNVQNYAYGLTSIKTPVYTIASALGIIPITLLNVWLGFLLSKETVAVSDIGTVFKNISIVLSIVITVIVVRLFLLRKKKKND